MQVKYCNNLIVFIRVVVEKVLLKEGCVIGVQVCEKGVVNCYFVKSEVILCGGVINLL